MHVRMIAKQVVIKRTCGNCQMYLGHDIICLEHGRHRRTKNQLSKNTISSEDRHIAMGFVILRRRTTDLLACRSWPVFFFSITKFDLCILPLGILYNTCPTVTLSFASSHVGEMR